jgi:hypothetical protein
MKPSEKQLGIARREGGSAAFNRPKGMRLDQLLKLCPYDHKALALAWRNAVRLHFGVNRAWSDGATSADAFED